MGTKRKRKLADLPYKGSGGDMAIFAPQYLTDRLKTFTKDMIICLTPRPSLEREGNTHAYFPGLINCCGMLELLANLYGGTTRNRTKRYDRIYAYGRFLRHHCYSNDNLRVLYLALRNATAHHSSAGGVWAENDKVKNGRRVTWTIYADYNHPALALKAESCVLRNDSPYDCPYTHRMHVRLGRLWRDIRDSVFESNGYLNALRSDPLLMQEFANCMEHIYPK